MKKILLAAILFASCNQPESKLAGRWDDSVYIWDDTVYVGQSKLPYRIDTALGLRVRIDTIYGIISDGDTVYTLKNQ